MSVPPRVGARGASSAIIDNDRQDAVAVAESVSAQAADCTLDDARAARLLEELVRTASPSHMESAAAALLVERMRALGFRAYVDAVGNAIGVIGDGVRKVALVGHIDTVPGDLPVFVRDGTLYGRGTVDAKGPLVAFVAAASRAAAANPDLCVTVVGCVQEEAASSAGARHLATTMKAPDFLVVGEPSAWDGVTLGYKGYLRARLALEDSVAHTAHDVRTVPARACGLWAGIEAAASEFDRGRERAFDRLLAALLDMRCTNDGQLARAELDLSLRLPPDLPPDAALTWLKRQAPEASVSVQGALPAWSGPRTTDLHRFFARAIARNGGRARFQQKTGTADLNILAPAWECPALAYGPGDAALDHTPHEHMPLDEFGRGIAVLTDALISLT